jgi:uncharacterized protein YceK
MRLYSCKLLVAVALTGFAAGCGTIVNVTAPTTHSSNYRAFGPTWCEPFGGVKRSVLAGSLPMMAGPLGIVVGVVAVAVDAPLSLVGDVVTLPIVYARLHGASEGNQEKEQGRNPPTVTGEPDARPVEAGGPPATHRPGTATAPN